MSLSSAAIAQAAALPDAIEKLHRRARQLLLRPLHLIVYVCTHNTLLAASTKYQRLPWLGRLLLHSANY